MLSLAHYRLPLSIIFWIVLNTLTLIYSKDVRLIVKSGLFKTIIEYFLPDSRPYGLTYGRWTVKWWQWLVSIPAEQNPAADEIGIYAAINQNDQPVWFLAGTFGGKSVNRKCVIPSKKSILFPVINYEINPIERPDLNTDSDLIRHVIEDEDSVLDLECIVDSQIIPVYRVRSDPVMFTINIHEHNYFEIPGGMTSRATSDGYWVFLKDLEIGDHNLYFAGSCSSGIRNVRASYNLKVLE